MSTTLPRPLVQHVLQRARLPPVALATMVGAVLALPLLWVAFRHGPPDTDAVRGLWGLGLEPAIITYILAIHSVLHGRWARVVDAIRPLSAHPDLIARAEAVDRRSEAAALLLGALFAVWVSLSGRPARGWIVAYVLATNVLLFGLMALSIHEGLRRARGLARIVRAGLAIDLFDRRPLAPLARWGLTVSLTFVGGICLSLVFQSYDDLKSLQALAIYSILLTVSLTLFFTSVWSVHVALVAAQQRELAMVRRQWERARDDLRRSTADIDVETAQRLYAPLAVFGTYEQHVRTASTWPYDIKVVQQLVASLVAPVLIYGVKIAAGRLTGGL